MMPLDAPTPVCIAYTIDGDTWKGCDGQRYRLKDIDAPELHGCRKDRRCAPGDGQASKAALTRILASGPVLCQRLGTDPYRRPLVRCRVNGQDVGASLIAGGFAVEWGR